MKCNYEGKDFGANYQDSQCINGKLFDLDNCDENGNLYDNDDYMPCPKCQTWGYVNQHFDEGEYLIPRMAHLIKMWLIIKWKSWILNLNSSGEKMSVPLRRRK